jgi:NAD(P)H-dependent flavin oxidoreductase YrpB (nitropropane dioxygenase family)
MTGFGIPIFSCVLNCAAHAKKPLIADGGVRTDGDIAKAIHAGATVVMAGSLFAACKNSPAETHTKYFRTGEVNPITHGAIPSYMNPERRVEATYEDRITETVFKRYYGSASVDNKHSHRHIEGTRVDLECNNLTYEHKLLEIQDSLQSALSYAGGDLKSVYAEVKK